MLDAYYVLRGWSPTACPRPPASPPSDSDRVAVGGEGEPSGPSINCPPWYSEPRGLEGNPCPFVYGALVAALLLSALGAVVVCLRGAATGSPDPRTSRRSRPPGARCTSRIGHALATTCFAGTAILIGMVLVAGRRPVTARPSCRTHASRQLDARVDAAGIAGRGDRDPGPDREVGADPGRDTAQRLAESLIAGSPTRGRRTEHRVGRLEQSEFTRRGDRAPGGHCASQRRSRGQRRRHRRRRRRKSLRHRRQPWRSLRRPRRRNARPHHHRRYRRRQFRLGRPGVPTGASRATRPRRWRRPRAPDRARDAGGWDHGVVIAARRIPREAAAGLGGDPEGIRVIARRRSARVGGDQAEAAGPRRLTNESRRIG